MSHSLNDLASDLESAGTLSNSSEFKWWFPLVKTKIDLISLIENDLRSGHAEWITEANLRVAINSIEDKIWSGYYETFEFL